MITQREKEVAQEYKVNSFPQIVIEESIDHKTGEIFSPARLTYYKGENKIQDIKEFIERFMTEKRLDENEIIRTLIL